MIGFQMTFSFQSKLIKYLLPLLMLTACGGNNGAEIDHTYPDAYRDRVQKYGSLSGNDEGGFNLMGENKRTKTTASDIGIGVNSYLWRASLDTLNFMPIASADPFGGVIITDWYSPPSTPHERFKVNTFILDRQLRADGVKVSIFRQEYNSQKGWHDVATSQKAMIDLENTILTRARQLHIQKN